MYAYFQFDDFLFCYVGKNVLSGRFEVTVDRLNPKCSYYNAVFDVSTGGLLRSQTNLSEREISIISRIVSENRDKFTLDDSKSYLKRNNNIHKMSTPSLNKLLSCEFLSEPDHLAEFKLQDYIIKSHCLRRFDTKFVEEALSEPDTEEVLKGGRQWRDEFYDDIYEEFTSFHKEQGWEKLGFKVKVAYSIASIDYLFIVGDGNGSYNYVLKNNDGFSYVNMPGEFIGTGDFLWIQNA